MYRVYDSYGEPLSKRFSSYQEAWCFICIMNRMSDWKIRRT